MKRMKVLLLLLAVAGAASVAMAYEPIVKENKQWVYYEHSLTSDGTPEQRPVYKFFPIIYEFKGDTLINGEVYKKLWEDRYKGAINNRPLPEVIHTYKVVAYVREYKPSQVYGPCVCAVRADSYEPLMGRYIDHTADGRGIYEVYDETGNMGYTLDFVPMTRYDREQLYDFKGCDYAYEMVEGGSGELVCWPTSNPYSMIVEGVGFFISGFATVTMSNANFIDLRSHKYNSQEEESYLSRMLSHVIVDGEIYYKSASYDFIHAHEIYDPDAPEGGGDVPSVVSELPVDGGATVADDRTYDLQGRAVNDPLSPGIYIRDGQKLLVE